MLSYRHGFHAGNHADVLKHAVLVHLLGYLTQKDKPLWFVDTHAGAAIYALDEGYATKNAEYESGVARLWVREDLPQPLADYVAQVRALNPDGYCAAMFAATCDAAAEEAGPAADVRVAQHREPAAAAIFSRRRPAGDRAGRRRLRRPAGRVAAAIAPIWC